MDNPDVTALLGLVDAGWTGEPVGDLAAPVMLVYHRTLPGAEDEVLVIDAGKVRACRRVGGSVTLPVSGTVAEVVAAVAAWPTVGPFEAVS